MHKEIVHKFLYLGSSPHHERGRTVYSFLRSHYNLLLGIRCRTGGLVFEFFNKRIKRL